jgi:hypothetical protein
MGWQLLNLTLELLQQQHQLLMQPLRRLAQRQAA